MLEILSIILMATVVIQKIKMKKIEYKLEEKEFEIICLKARLRVNNLSVNIEDLEEFK